MAKVLLTRDQLKDIFKDGYKPQGSDYGKLIDNMATSEEVESCMKKHKYYLDELSTDVKATINFDKSIKYPHVDIYQKTDNGVIAINNASISYMDDVIEINIDNPMDGLFAIVY